MKNWIFQIKFSGLTAFVMRRDRSGARVFLMNALDMVDQRHRPELRFDERNVKTSPWGIPFPKDVINVDPSLPNMKRWMLAFLDLNFLPAPDVTLKEDFELDPSIKDYLVRFTDIFQKASEINPVCFNTAPPPALVSVRVPLRHGKLKTTVLAFRPFGKTVVCQFVAKGKPAYPIPHKQKCAIEVVLEFAVEKGPLTLVGAPFSGPPSSGIALEPTNGNRKVVVELENRPVGEEKSSRFGGKDIDEDFSLHYNLSLNCHPDHDRIVPLYDHIARLGSQNCIIGRFADNDSA